jgi:hypothetical protein
MDMLLLMVVGILSRLIPHLPNATAVGAAAVMAGKRLGWVRGLATVAVTMIVTDAVYGHHPAIWAVYASFALAVLLGRAVGNRGFVPTAAVTGISTGIFFLLTNFAVWLSPVSAYPKTVSGLAACYAAGLPFLRNAAIGDFLYIALLYFGFALVGVPSRRKANYSR